MAQSLTSDLCHPLRTSYLLGLHEHVVTALRRFREIIVLLTHLLLDGHCPLKAL